jgi:hypothetical protein
VIRRLTIDWPVADMSVGTPLAPRPIRVLAVSDQVDHALDFARNRAELKPVDAVFGCGDLEPDYLAFLGDAFGVPLLYVRGNHDRGGGWQAGSARLPEPLDDDLAQAAGICVGGLSWPHEIKGRAVRDEASAWRQVLAFRLRSWRSRPPRIVLSHVPPLGLGDTPEDFYHRGFAAYHWLCAHTKPILWLHGHTAMATTRDWHVQWGTTTLVNVTGAVLLELQPAGSRAAPSNIAVPKEGT